MLIRFGVRIKNGLLSLVCNYQASVLDALFSRAGRENNVYFGIIWVQNGTTSSMVAPK
ncbi:hypothetical protein RED65_16391 [Oceanobacter sp. RED65]|uniref:Uncharacterized protein n=1 Tax=Bermanella marisrubri TaxID=207949 RepID=Q1N2H3_9GAMM|nr:hypothetical protein RED65_16391 [Oceanobacter sp. RED65] [Bermanella marisrubri]